MQKLGRYFRILAIVVVIGGLVLFLSGCGDKEARKAGEAITSVMNKDLQATARNYERLYEAVPPPELDDSQERHNLVKRLKRFNTSEKISYIYLVNFGKIITFAVVQGKVSSVNSALTTQKQMVKDGHGDHGGRRNVHTVPSPQLDGSYGTNGDAVFFFNDKDIYFEWNGTYLLTDEYIEVTTPPTLVRDVTPKDKKESKGKEQSEAKQQSEEETSQGDSNENG